MKYCSTCQEEFEDKYSFCPMDGSALDPQPDYNAVNPNEETSMVTADASEDSKSVRNQPSQGVIKRRKRLATPSQRGRRRAKLETKQQADVALRNKVGLSLILLFGASVLFSYLVILGIGRGILILHPSVTATILAGTITEGAILYRRVVRSLFPANEGEMTS